jgi:hypothetical protein
MWERSLKSNFLQLKWILFSLHYRIVEGLTEFLLFLNWPHDHRRKIARSRKGLYQFIHRSHPAGYPIGGRAVLNKFSAPGSG